MGVQPLENKALSWGIIRKSACALTEITIRKSQALALALPCVFLPTLAPYALAVAIVLLAPEPVPFFRLQTFAP
jgi:hypothetical protein